MIDLNVLKHHLSNIASASLSYQPSTILPHEFAEQRRVLSEAESPSRPGQFSYDHTPLTKEIIDCLSPLSPVNNIAIMKSAQYGITDGFIINGILYIISECPGPIMFLSGDLGLSQGIVEKRLDPAITNAGLRHLIKPLVTKARNNRTGDTTKQKEFRGGFLIADGIQHLEAKMRQETIQYLFADDWERAPRNTEKGGDTFGLTQTRMSTLGFRRKGCYISTPEIHQTSSIRPLYEVGDRRKWFIKCPCCGEFINLEFRAKNASDKTIFVDGKSTGLIFEVENGIIIRDSVFYRCQICGGTFTETKKFEIIGSGKWIPTAIAKQENFRSYHINALYSPPGGKSWFEICEQFQRAHPRNGKPDTGLLQVFNNTILGIPWKEKGKSINANKLSRNTRKYKPFTVPNLLSIEDGNGSIVALTFACDLNGLNDDARVDWEIVGWSKNGASYSIAHGSIGTFQRSTARRAKASKKFEQKEKDRVKWTYDHNVDNSVWSEIKNLGESFYQSDDGEEYQVSIALIDVSNTFADNEGDNPRAYTFLDNNQTGLFWGAKGADDPRIRKIEADRLYYKKSRARGDLWILDVDTIKDHLSSAFDQIHQDGCLQPADFCNFPEPSNGLYTAKFFDQYSSEERQLKLDSNGNPVGFKWRKKSSTAQNHFFDCRVYNVCAKQILFKEACKELGITQSWESYSNYLGY